MQNDIIKETLSLEKAVLNENIQEMGHDLPQAANQNEAILNTLQQGTYLPHEMLNAEMNGQIDPSYD